MKSAIVSISAAVLLACAGTALATPPLVYVGQSVQLHRASVAGLAMPPADQAVCRQELPSFDSMEAHKRGYVTERELVKEFEKQHLSTKNLHKDFRQVNTSHNGRLNRSEYNDWVAECENAG